MTSTEGRCAMNINLTRVKLILDIDEDEVEVVDAYLTPDGMYVIYVFDGVINYVGAVRTQNKRIYLEDGGVINITLGQTDRGPIAALEVYDRLASMSALELLNRYVIHDVSSIDLNRYA
jgi:hypothetical protein